VAAGLAGAYRQDGHTVHWVAADIASHPHRGHADDHPFACWNTAEDRFGFPWPVPRPGALRRLAREVRWCDVVHMHDTLYLANVLAFWLARRAGKPILVTQHAGEVPFGRRPLRWLQAMGHRVLSRPLLARADKVAFDSRPVLEYFQAFCRFRADPIVIELGVDTTDAGSPADRGALRRELGLPDGVVLLFVGRFVERKGVDLIREVAGARPDWNWVMVGRAGDEDPASWGLSNVQVRERLSRSELTQLYRACDLLVLPSTGEGGYPPLVVREAMACGLPAVVSREVADGSDAAARGQLFSTERGGAALGAAIAAALPTLSPRVSAEARRLAVECWDLKRQTALYTRTLTALLPT